MRRTLAVMLLLPALAAAQAERYELGQRLKAFEQSWEKQTDPAARKRALEVMPKVTTQFFAFQLGEAGRTLDEARFRLESKDGPSDAVRWLTSLYMVPEKRLVDAATKELAVEVKTFYKVLGDMPEGSKATIALDDDSIIDVPLGKLPIKLRLPLSTRGQTRLAFSTSYRGNAVRHQYFQIEAIEKLDQFIKECESTLDKFDPTDEAKRTINSATLRENITLIKGLAEGDVPETDYKHLTLISWIKRWDAVEKTGMYDLLENSLPLQSLPLGKKNTLPFRIDGLRKSARSKPVPVVIALHGAGGSENLFFEGYGDGYAVKACQKRGWIIVSPRGGLNFNSGPPVKKLIDAVAKKYPVDMKRIFFVGHSMGGAQAVALCQEHPGLFAAAAVLGGGGTVKDAKPFASLPMHIGYGSQDIGRGGAKALNKALVAGGAKNVTLKEYLDLDHLVIVREALPDVFALFDRVSDDIQKAK